MDPLAVLVPVLRRPHRVRPTLDGFTSTADCTVYFIPNPNDDEEIAAIEDAGGTILFTSKGGYAKKINEAVGITIEPLVFIGADDLEPQPGWFENAFSLLRDDIQVVGINDLIKRERIHSTHFLMTRSYAERPLFDGTPGPLHEGYTHWYCDDELIGTARRNGAYAYAENAIVKHLHPMANTAEDDETYQLGRKFWRRDRRLYATRRRIWTAR